MPYMISIFVLVLIVTLTVVCGKSIPSSSPEITSSRSDAQELVLLELPVNDKVEGRKMTIDGDLFLVDGKNFTSVEELGNILQEERKGKSVLDGGIRGEETQEPFSLVVPVARNFSSFKELFEILREDRGRPHKAVNGKEHTFVKGTENEDSGLMIFFTS